jgi:hypothetical protein
MYLAMNTLLKMTKPDAVEWIDCAYVNATSTIQVVRISNVAHWYLERVVWPGLPLLFRAPLEAVLEVYDNAIATSVLAARIPCEQLACSEEELCTVTNNQ